MQTKQSFVALVPLRGGSKSIKNKNIKNIAGKPLCAWVLEAACQASRIDKVYVSTDSMVVKEVVSNLGLEVELVDRPEHLARDNSSTEDVLLHFMDLVDFENLVTIQATSPLLTAKDLDEAIGMYNEQALDSLLTAVRYKRFFWNDDATPINYDPANRPRRQDFKGTLMENGAFYVTNRSILKKDGCRLGGKTGVYEMAEETATEIDEPSDWTIMAELLSRNKIK